jgi:hypothetical protein
MVLSAFDKRSLVDVKQSVNSTFRDEYGQKDSGEGKSS